MFIKPSVGFGEGEEVKHTHSQPSRSVTLQTVTAVVGMVDLIQGLCDPALGVFRANIDKREYIRKSIYIPKSQ